MQNSSHPQISLVIPAYNEEKFIGTTLKSVFAQKTDVPCEVLVINNASIDKTSEVAEALGAKVILEKRKGLCFAREAGLTHAKGEITIFIDADTHLPPDFTEKIVQYMEKHPEVSGASCSFTFYDSVDPISVVLSFLYREIVTRLVNLVLSLLNKPEMFWGLCMITRTNVFRSVGGVDMDFPFYGDDTVIAYRLAKKGKVKFLYNVRVLTSGRRYKSKSAGYYLFMTTTVFFMLHAGLYKQTKAFVTRQTKPRSATPLS